MSNQDDVVSIDPSFGMKLTLAGIRKKFSEVKQLSTDNFYKMWLPHFAPKNSDSCNASSHASLHAEDDFVLFDVRERNERLVSFIKGSIWIDSSQDFENQVKEAQTALIEKVTKLNEKQTNQNNEKLNVVAYCSIGYRSSDLIRQLLKSDISSISSKIDFKFYNLDGSLFKWANEGRPIVDANDSSTPFVHPYNSIWGKLLNEKLRKWSN